MDLIVRQAQLADRSSSEFADIGIQDGRIVAIEPSLGTDCPTYDAAGRLVCGGLVGTHIHLDKAHLLDRGPALPWRDIKPVPHTSAVKTQASAGDVYTRAARGLREVIIH